MDLNEQHEKYAHRGRPKGDIARLEDVEGDDWPEGPEGETKEEGPDLVDECEVRDREVTLEDLGEDAII